MAELNKKSSIKYDSDKIDQKVSKNQNSMKIEQMNFDISETNDLQIVRCHWIQLYKLNLQHSLIEETLTYIFENYANIRNIFHFGRRINLKQENWRKILKNDAHFHYHCTNIQCAITTIMDKLEDEISLRNFLIKLGNRHFFYNVYEIHLTIFQEAIITTLRQLLLKIDLNDKNLEKSWRIFMNEIKEKISAGIAKQRTYYLENCLNVKELQLISDLWNHINHNNHSELAKILYEQLNENEAISKTNMQQDGVYDEFCTFLIKTIDITINGYEESNGFKNLPQKIDFFARKCFILQICPSILRKYLTEDLSYLLIQVLHFSNINEIQQQAWNKLCRITEQAIISQMATY